jgi:hypothetical protein
MSTHVLGIRHHGPGCARSLTAALDALAPDAIALEGPADVEPILPLVMHEEIKPPVAMLVYAPAEPRRASYYPLALYSPEWQALRWAHSCNVRLRMMDLPQRHSLAMDREAQETAVEQAMQADSDDADADTAGAAELASVADGNGAADENSLPPSDGQEAAPPDDAATWRTDPIAVLAAAAGFKDHELWWEVQIERRRDPTNLFQAILEAMRAVRAHAPPPPERDLLREAFMRSTIRGLRSEGHERIAVICGAYHAPVLDDDALDDRTAGCTKRDDAARTKGLPKLSTEATWIPWTNSRLTFRSGYGAGVVSPGWYAHL